MTEAGAYAVAAPRPRAGGAVALRELARRHRIAVAVLGSLAVAGALLFALAGRRHEFAAALSSLAPVVLALAALLQSAGAAAAVLILGSDGVAAAAAAGVLLTVTGTAGGLAFATWAGADKLWSLRGRRGHAQPVVREALPDGP